MKKYLLTISAMLTMLVAGCEMFPPDDSQIAPVAGSAPTIDIPEGSVGDSTFTVTITPAAGTGFYAYLITDTKSAIDGSSLLSQSYEGLYTGLENAAEIESVTINANAAGGIMPGTLYYIYAVGASQEQGIASAAVYDSVYTTNSNVPIFDDEVAFAASADGSYVDIALNDVVKAGEGKVYYDVFSTYGGYSIFDTKQVVPADSIVYSGKIVRVKTPANVPNGAVVNITWDEGAFVNSADKMAKAYTVCNYTGLDTKLGDGILYRKAPVSWTISYPDVLVNDTTLHSTAEDVIGIEDLTADGFRFTIDSTILGNTTYPHITYHNQNGSVFSYDGFGGYGMLNDSTLVILVDPTYSIEKGTWMSIEIPANAFVDEYGNGNAAFSSNENFIYSFGWEMEDLLGTYQVSAYEGLFIGQTLNLGSVTISAVASDDKNAPEGSNVLIKDLLYEGSNLYATFGGEDGLLHISGGQVLNDDLDSMSVEGYLPIYDYVENGNDIDTVIVGYEKFKPSLLIYALALSGNQVSLVGNDITFQLVQPGVITDTPADWVSYYPYWACMLADGSSLINFNNGFLGTLMTRDENAAAAASIKPFTPRKVQKPAGPLFVR